MSSQLFQHLAREYDLYHLTDNGNTMPTTNKTTICFLPLNQSSTEKNHYSHALIWRIPEQST
jgi:hypothetical protein